MGRAVVIAAVLLAGCTSATGEVAGPRAWYLQANLAGGWADGAEATGSDDVTVALTDAIGDLPSPPAAVFLNEACESHAIDAATRLGPGWQAFFVRAWDGHSDCHPAPGASEGRFGNAVLVDDAGATALVVPSCNDVGAEVGRCLPNWAPPAEQRRGACALTTARIALCSFHLDPRHWAPHAEQLAALGELAGRLADEYDGVVVGGDLNDGRRAVERAFDVRFTDLTAGRNPPTYPAAGPTRDLDHLLAVMPGTTAGGGRTIDLGACGATHRDDGRCTDHLALLASLVLG